jgi:RimJ/RimL family protein N-acetyltransferase
VETKQVALERHSEAHLEKTFQWLQDADLRAKIDSLSAPPSKEENRRYWEKRWADPAQVNFAILNGHREHVGNCGLSSIDRNRKKAELWIYIGDVRRGQGLGGMAAWELLRFGFHDLELNRIYLRVVEDNLGALRFYQAIGFKEEGRFREDTLRDGRYYDSIWLSILKREWKRG